MQDSRAFVRAPPGDGFPEPWAHAGRHHGDPRFARYCVRGNRPVINLIPNCGELDSSWPASALERCAHISLDRCTFLQWMSRWNSRRMSQGLRVLVAVLFVTNAWTPDRVTTPERKTARFHHAARRRGGCVAARGAGARETADRSRRPRLSSLPRGPLAHDVGIEAFGGAR